MQSTAACEREVTATDRVRFYAGSVVGDDRIEVSFDRQLHTSDVAGVLAHRLMLPANVPAYALRSERLGRYLEDEAAIGEQVVEGEELTVTPKTHLGVISCPLAGGHHA